MDPINDPIPPDLEPHSYQAGTTISDRENTLSSETDDNTQRNESNQDNRSEIESKNCLNVISNEEKQYDNCCDIVDIYEQESKQQKVNSTHTTVSNQNTDVYRNLSPIVELPTLANAEELLKSNEVLSSTFDTSVYSDDDTPSSNTFNNSQSSQCTDAEACLTRECSVSLPNIDNLLSQTDENGRTDAGKIENSIDLMSTSYYDPDSSQLANDNTTQIQDTYMGSVSTQSADDTIWTDGPDTEYDDLSYSDCNTSAASSKSNLKRGRDISDTSTPIKKPKKGITFDSVSVYYFPRTQGFTCIPSQGGSTLGMSWNHSHIKKFSLGEHAAEQRRVHKQFCAQQISNSRNWNEMSTISSEDSDSDEIISDSEMDFENYNFLQPIPTRERRAMLRAAGIQKIDSGEKDECRSIRLSREFCGCTCQIYCDPERCVCAQAGIKCQVDRMNFPCSCTREGCGNENGRVEFNPVRVRTHYIHTLMRLEMEKKKEEEEQRNKMILNSMDSNVAAAQLYSNTSLDELTSGGGANNLMNFAYHHNDLQSYYSQPAVPGSYGDSMTTSSPSSSIVNSCFNFAYGDQFVLPSPAAAAAAAAAAASIAYHESMSHSNIMRMPASNEYCCSGGSVNTSVSDHHHHHQPHQALRASEYNDDDDDLLTKQRNDQSFVLRDLSNGSDNDGSVVDANLSYTNDAHSTAYMQMNESYDHASSTGEVQSTSLDASVEVNEETEKEESDSENFGNIIKKTMVESVIA